MRVGLVLGAGGVVGASWLIGALEALEAETGFAPGAADRIVGTSAGSVLGALIAAGHPPTTLSAYSRGEHVAELDAIDELAGRAGARSVGDEYRFSLLPLPFGIGSWRLALSAWSRPARHSPALLLSSLMPRGFMHTDPISRLIERFVPSSWPQGAEYWAVACDFQTGARVPFGSPGAPPANIAEAVAASCAIPAFYRPVGIGGRRYVDGGIHSPSNLDLLADGQFDLVVCLNPMSSLAPSPGGGPGARLVARIRAAAGRRLGAEARTLRAQGTDVLLIQPGAADLAVMGSNLMARDRREKVIAVSYASTVRALRRRGAGDEMPPRRSRPDPPARSGAASERAA